VSYPIVVEELRSEEPGELEGWLEQEFGRGPKPSPGSSGGAAPTSRPG